MTPHKFSLDPLFRYATCQDLVALKARYPQFCMCEPGSLDSMTWGLKEMGHLFCIDLMQQLIPGRALEVGAGLSRFFDEAIGQTWESWMIDEPGFYAKERYEYGIRNRKYTRCTEGLMGEFLEELEPEYFDVVYSVSVMEHVPLEKLNSSYADMYRITKPGGFIIHSIDTSDSKAGNSHFEAIKNAGFQLPEAPDFTISIRHSDDKPATLFEPLAIVFNHYSGFNRADMWTKLVPVPAHYPTILVTGKK